MTANADNDDDNADQWLQCQSSSLMIMYHPLCTHEWDQFYQEHLQFMMDCYPELLPKTPLIFDNHIFSDNKAKPISNDCSPTSHTYDNQFLAPKPLIMASDDAFGYAAQSGTDSNHPKVHNVTAN